MCLRNCIQMIFSCKLFRPSCLIPNEQNIHAGPNGRQYKYDHRTFKYTFAITKKQILG